MINNPAQDQAESLHLVVVSAGASDPSSTRLLADRAASAVAGIAEGRGRQVTVTNVELRAMANEISAALTTTVKGPAITAAAEALAEADGLVVSTPVYSAGPSGLFTSFFQLLDDDLLIAKPVILAATAGTTRHALVVDEQMRSLFAYLRTLSVPTSLFAAHEDWNDPALGVRIDRAALELVLLMESGFATQVRELAWRDYRHQFGTATADSLEVDFDSDLMRLAAGGTTRAPDPAPTPNHT